MNRSKWSFKNILSGKQPVIECGYLKEYFFGLIGCKRSTVRLDLPHEHQISICYLYFLLLWSSSQVLVNSWNCQTRGIFPAKLGLCR